MNDTEVTCTISVTGLPSFKAGEQSLLVVEMSPSNYNWVSNRNQLMVFVENIATGILNVCKVWHSVTVCIRILLQFRKWIMHTFCTLKPIPAEIVLPPSAMAPTNSATIVAVVVAVFLSVGGACVPIAVCIWCRTRKCRRQKTER